MAEEVPGAHGVDHLARLIVDLTKDMGAVLRHQSSLLTHLHRLEKYMADQFDGLRNLIASAQQAAKDEAAQVRAKLDEMGDLVQQLQDTINQGVPVPQDVANSMMDLIADVSGILPDNLPPPTP